MLVFWLALKSQRNRLIFMLVLSVAVLALLNPAFAAIAVGLVLVTHQLIELRRAEKLSGGRVVLIAVAIALITLGIGKYGQRGAIAVWGAGRLDRDPPHHAARHQLLRVPPAPVHLRLHARRDQGELPAASHAPS